MTNVVIIGVGIHPFGRTPGMTGRQMGLNAVRLAMTDAGIKWKDMQFAYGGSSASGKADVMNKSLGLTAIPFTNINNACATGGSSLMQAYYAIKSGEHDIGLAVGFDKHERGSFSGDPELIGLPQWYGESGMIQTIQFFAMKLQRYMHDHNISKTALARVAEKAFINGSKNPNAWRREPVDIDTILNSTMVVDPLTKYMFCSPSEGGAALIVCSEKKARELGVKGIHVKGALLRTRQYGSLETFTTTKPLVDADVPSTLAAKAIFEKAGVGPEDIDLAQLQDTESGAEIMHMAETGFCEHGEQEHMLANGETMINGRLPINTDGGCIASGEPIGASGLRQIVENVYQLRGQAGDRQVPNDPKLAFSHVYGQPGVSAVTILSR